MNKPIRTNADCALTADRLQWILQRRRTGGWRPVAFVSSTKDVLARCMRENGIPSQDAEALLSRLPDTFSQWARSPSGLDGCAGTPPPMSRPVEPEITAVTSDAPVASDAILGGGH